MAYKVIISPRAQIEISEVIEYYRIHSNLTPFVFIQSLEISYKTLEINPFFRKRYKNIRGLNIKKFPHTLFYQIDEESKVVKVLSCFHSSRNPSRRPQIR
jgi:mRNA-degrading endonuclease RelE of RelBE toxin-antitoxin system